MTLQELDTINAIAIQADANFKDMLTFIGIGAADSGIILTRAGRDDTKTRRICEAIDKVLIERGDNHE